jgi:translocator assembly and maintenance protein 41
VSESDPARTKPGWEDAPDWNIADFKELPHRQFGYNQFVGVNNESIEFTKCLQVMTRTFHAPIAYAFAYGSGVFSQSGSPPTPSSLSPHPNPPEAVTNWQKGGGKMIDLIFGVSHTQHWHSLNLRQHPQHYSALGRLGSGAVSYVQDSIGAGVYFNPYITINGTLVKYGVVNLETLRNDLSEWSTLYLAGRLQKPVKIIRDSPKVRLANQVNLISALRAALLMLGPTFSEKELYTKIAGLSYMGDPRMDIGGEDPNKVRNIVTNQMTSFRQLYAPLVAELPNASFDGAQSSTRGWLYNADAASDTAMSQDMDPVRRGNMVRRLPEAFRTRLYMEYRKKWQIPGREFDRIMDESRDEDAEGFRRRDGGQFDRRIANEEDVPAAVGRCVRQTVAWPSLSQSVKAIATAGIGRSWRYAREKRAKGRLKSK